MCVCVFFLLASIDRGYGLTGENTPVGAVENTKGLDLCVCMCVCAAARLVWGLPPHVIQLEREATRGIAGR